MYAKSPAQEANPSLAAIAAILAPARDFEVWPENMPAINLYLTVQTQWRAGASGLIGLDHNVVLAHMSRMHLTDRQHTWLFDDIRAIEGAALEILNKRD